jgi:hypothetical protein
MSKCCAAQEIGPEACWLVTVIAHQGDAIRYARPVTFFNGQLMPIYGFDSEGRLIRARARAVEGGWLHYDPGCQHHQSRLGQAFTIFTHRSKLSRDISLNHP